MAISFSSTRSSLNFPRLFVRIASRVCLFQRFHLLSRERKIPGGVDNWRIIVRAAITRAVEIFNRVPTSEQTNHRRSSFQRAVRGSSNLPAFAPISSLRTSFPTSDRTILFNPVSFVTAKL